MRRSLSRLPAAALLIALAAPACGDRGDEPAVEDSTPAPSPQAAERMPMADIRAPVFGGLESVELLGLDYFRLRWSAATDDTSPPENIRYEVFHLVEPYLELASDAQPIFTSPPGATEALLAHDVPPGRFYVRAKDEAGNVSTLAAGLIQRPERPLIRASDGTLAARITDCAETAPGEALCVGEAGFAARWTPEGWQSLDLGLSTAFQLANTQTGVFIYTSIGHLFAYDPESGEAHLVDLRFPRRAPTLPFRQFTADGVGLRYWIDSDRRVFIGADRAFVPMVRPLALPGSDCRRVRAFAFAELGSFALCDGGTAFSADPTTPGSRWLSLTPTADFDLPAGLSGALATDDTEAFIYDPTGIRRIGVGGWLPVLLTDWRQPGIHPMDIPEDPPDIDRVVRAFRYDGRLYAVTDGGLLAYEGAEWDVVSGIDDALAGVIGPSVGASRSDWVYVFEDGAVGRVRRGEIRWAVERALTGFLGGYMTSTGEAVARVSAGPRAGFHVWRNRRWAPLFGPPDAEAAIAGLAGEGDRAVAFGSLAGVGEIWSPSGRSWPRARWLYAPPEPVAAPAVDDGVDAGAGLVFEAPDPPPPIRSVEAAELPVPPPPPEPIVHVDVAPDGRAVAVGQHEVWWRVGRGWRLLGRRPGMLTAAFVDSGESYVLVEDGHSVRCWRDECEGLVPSVVGGPTDAIGAFAGAAGWEVVDSDGSTWRFVRASDGGEVFVDPAVELPVGSWEEMTPVGDFAGEVLRRVEGDGYGAMLLEDGSVYERRGSEWVLQAEDADALTVLAVDDGWAILTARGLFRLGEVRPARREAPAP